MAGTSRSKRTRRAASPPQEEEEVPQVPSRRGRQMSLDEKKAAIRSWQVADERGFDLDNLESARNYRPTIDSFYWSEFARHPVKPNLTLVREFYCNLATSKKKDEVTVFGRVVSFSPQVINSLFNIPDLDGRDWFRYHYESHPNDAEMRHVLSLGNDGNINPRTGCLMIGSYCEEAKRWRKFMSGRILGTKRDGETTYDQQIMLFCILVRKRFDVGVMINSKINRMKEKIRIGSIAQAVLAFPSLITMLCRHVPIPRNSVEIAMMQPFSDHTIPSRGHNDMSVYDFHQLHWGRRGESDWQPPMIGQPQLPSPPHEANQPPPETGSSSASHFSFDQDGWNSYQAIQANRHQELVSSIASISLRQDGLYGRLDTLEQKQDAFYRRADAYFQRGEQASDSDSDQF